MQSNVPESFSPIVNGEPSKRLVTTKYTPMPATAFAMNIDAMADKII